MGRSKYNAKRVIVDGINFDSIAESRHYRDLTLRIAAGEIRDLELQPSYPIVINGKKICVYKADFRYFDIALGKVIVEDVKGMKTAVYRLKKKLVEAMYDIEITEVVR